MKRNIIYAVLLLLFLCHYTAIAQNEETEKEYETYTVEELNARMAMIEQELDGIRKSKASEIAEKEIDAIENGIKLAKKRINNNELIEAHYTLDLARALFSKIEARMELYYSKQIYESTRDKLSK